MREKLYLLFENLFSPPNPRVSGGHFPPVSWSSLIHHGGCPLRYGVSLLRHGGSGFHLLDCCCKVNTEIWFTTNMASSRDSRPPPEPQPPLFPPFSLSGAPPSTDLFPPRPDPKPPWMSCGSPALLTYVYSKAHAFLCVGVLIFSFYGLCFNVYFGLLVLCYFLLCWVVFYFNVVPRMFVEMPMHLWPFGNDLLHPVSIRTGARVNNNLIYLSQQQAAVIIVNR
ncbi:hypothetical protein OROMI_004987 [Orobanche minor]